MTEEERRSEAALRDQVLAHIPSPFRGRVEPRAGSAVILREGWAGPTRILAGINPRRDGYDSDVVNRRSGKNDTTAAVESKCVRISRKDRTVTIHGDEPMASVFLGGGYGREGRTVAAADYGVIRDEDVIAPAVSFLAFEGD